MIPFFKSENTEISAPVRSAIRWLWISVISLCLLIVMLFVYIGTSDLPGFEQLENPKYDLASVIYDVNGTPFGRYYVENRIPIEYNDLSDDLKHALLSTEDDRFFKHSGIDLRALFRVTVKTARSSRPSAT